MVVDSLRYGFSKFSLINLLKKVPIILGCLLFLLSILFPFCSYYPILTFDDKLICYYWSFKSSTHIFYTLERYIVRIPNRVVDYWFYEYWFSHLSVFEPWILIFMFIIQILTVATGIVSIFNTMRGIILCPVILCSIVLVLMIAITSIDYYLIFGSYQLGYWLIYPSLFLFLLNFIMSLYFKKKAQS
jgi:hypothetical protein